MDEKGIYAQNYIHSMGQPMKIKGFPDSSAGKESTRNAGDLGSIPGLGRSPGEGKGYPLQYSGLENSMHCMVHGVAESDMTERFTFIYFIYFHMKAMIKLGQGIWRKEKQLDLLAYQTTGNFLLDFHFHEHCMDICNFLLPYFACL